MKRSLSLFAAIGLLALIISAIPSSFSSAVSKTACINQDTIKVILEKTDFKDMTVLYITDTAQTNVAISEILGRAYGELMQYISEKKLQPIKFMAWYYSTQPPWQMDIAVQTGALPAELSGRIKSRVQQGGEVLIARMWGPYDQVGQAYLKIQNWIKENKRKPKGNPFEVYLNDPSSVKSPSEIRTDIYQPIE